MNKKNGSIEDFSYIKDYDALFVIGYDLQKVTDDMYSWYEIYLFKDKNKTLDFNEIKGAILKDIDARTDYGIENDFVWTSFDQEQIPVKLDAENKFNFKASYDLAVQTQGATLPVTFKMSEKEIMIEPKEEGGIHALEKQSVYHTFSTMEEATDFYMKAMAFIQGCYQEGWQKKDNFDWSKYNYQEEVQSD